MTNDNRQSSGGGEQLRKYLSDLGRLIARFLWDLAKMLGQGAFILYRTIGQRRTQPERDADRATRGADNALEDAKQQRETSGGRKRQFVDDPSDEEAASMLEELLQQTAKKVDTAASADEGRAPDADPAAALDLPDSPADVDEIEQQIEGKVSEQSEAEQERIKKQLAEREALLAEEREERRRAVEQDKARKAEREQAVQSDLERIREERRQREEIFQKAEAERRGQAAPADNRMADDEPETTADQDDDEGDDVQRGNTS